MNPPEFIFGVYDVWDPLNVGMNQFLDKWYRQDVVLQINRIFLEVKNLLQYRQSF